MKAKSITHLSISAHDLDRSVDFYTELFGMEEVPAPEFPFEVRWLRIGGLQIHLFQSEGPAPSGHHFGLDVDDFVGFYERVKELGLADSSAYFQHVYELPEGALQLYIRDPAGNMVELNYPDVEEIDRSRIDGIRKLEAKPGESPAIYMDR
ncbi:VOC family protein [Rubrobacter indicoceani]|uniref:VOC family protein n=1 Tax=Rubrobacter indicoceani TaxID=2051957 RepID=UPI000E5A1A53|nr:VOC family protein [Rubrobacter indicoceani]